MLDHWSKRLRQHDACQGAVDWTQQYPTPEAAWAACMRSDWMLWALLLDVKLANERSDRAYAEFIRTMNAAMDGICNQEQIGQAKVILHAAFATLKLAQVRLMKAREAVKDVPYGDDWSARAADAIRSAVPVPAWLSEQ
jgi:hypothetical protein